MINDQVERFFARPGKWKEEFHRLRRVFMLYSRSEKAYLFYFNQAKQVKTSEVRIEKYYTQLMEGKGMDD